MSSASSKGGANTNEPGSAGGSRVKPMPTVRAASSSHPDYVNDTDITTPTKEEPAQVEQQAANVEKSSDSGKNSKCNTNVKGVDYANVDTDDLNGTEDLSNGIATSSEQAATPTSTTGGATTAAVGILNVSDIVSAMNSFKGSGALEHQDKTKPPLAQPRKKQRPFSSMPIGPQVLVMKEKLERRSVVGPLNSEYFTGTKAPSHLPLTSSVSDPTMKESPTPNTPTPSSAPPLVPAALPLLPTTNHRKRLPSSKCRVEWTLPFKPMPASKPSSLRDLQVSAFSEEEAMPLPQLVAERWNQFPLKVRVVKGLLEEQLSSRSILDIHFLKKTKVIDICDALNQRYLIPHNSPIRFGVLYCPGVKNENYYFEKVSDMIQAPDLPKVVLCTRKVKGKDDKANLSSNEVLIVIEIVRSTYTYSKLPKKPKLKVFSFTDRKEKVLTGDMLGRFTTDPRQAQFYIPEIMDYIPNPFPLSARLYMDTESEYPLPEILTKSPITILGSTIEESIIGNLQGESKDPSDSLNHSNMKKDLIELPIVSDIMVSVIPEDQIQLNTIENLYADTQTLWRNLVAPPNKNPVCPRVAVSGKNPVQHKLSTLTRKGEEMKGLAIEAPPLVRKDLPLVQGSPDKSTYQVLIDGMAPNNQYMMPLRSLSSSNSSCETNRSSSTTDEAEIGGSMSEGVGIGEQDGELLDKQAQKPKKDSAKQEEQLPEFHRSTLRLVRRVEAVESRVAIAAPQSIVHRLTRRVEALENKSPQNKRKISAEERMEIEELKMDMEAMRVAFKTLEEEVRQMRGQLAQVLEANNGRTKLPNQPADASENITVLKRLDSDQVLRLLDMLQLSQYKEVFTEEAITGEILAECTESVLMDDLDIKDSGNRSKLLNVIYGELSAQELLDCFNSHTPVKADDKHE